MFAAIELQTNFNLAYFVFVGFVFAFFLPSNSRAQSQMERGDEWNQSADEIFDPDFDAPESEQLRQFDIAKVHQWLDQLASPKYQLRERAEIELMEMGKPIVPIIESTRTNDIEQQWRVNRIIEILTRPPIADTRWILQRVPGKTQEDPQTRFTKIEFFNDETFKATNSDGDGEHWKILEDGKIEFSYNHGYSVYVGEYIGKRIMKGTAGNRKGKKWAWIAVRQR